MDSTQPAMIAERSEQLHGKWRQLIEVLLDVEFGDGQRFDTTLLIPNLSLSVDDLNIQIETIFNETSSLLKAPIKSFLLAPPMAIRRLQESLDKTIGAIDELLDLFKKPLKSFNTETFQGSAAHPSQPSRQIPVNFVENFTSIARHLDEAFVRSIQLKSAHGSTSRESNFDTLVDKIRDAEKHAREYFSGLKEKDLAIQRMLDNASSSSHEVETMERELSEKYENCSKISLEFEDSSKELDETVEKISEIASTASDLKKQVVTYQDEFDQFQASLNSHKENLLSGQREQERLLKEIAGIENQIEEKNSQASDMLANATVAGLASSFGSTRDKLNVELTWARRVFYGSILVLFMLSIPMILYVIPGLTTAGDSMHQNGSNGFGEIVSQVFARATILLPGILFVAFASRRHSSLFRLREHYVYKYNMAASVEGFKQQAPEISGAIAGTTFYELLTHNPADTMDGGRQQLNANRQTQDNPLAEAVKRFLSKKEGPPS